MADAIREMEIEEQAREMRRTEDQRMEEAKEARPRPPASSIAEEEEGGHTWATQAAERPRSEQRGQEDRGEYQVHFAGSRSTG